MLYALADFLFSLILTFNTTLNWGLGKALSLALRPGICTMINGQQILLSLSPPQPRPNGQLIVVFLHTKLLSLLRDDVLTLAILKNLYVTLPNSQKYVVMTFSFFFFFFFFFGVCQP